MKTNIPSPTPCNINVNTSSHTHKTGVPTTVPVAVIITPHYLFMFLLCGAIKVILLVYGLWCTIDYILMFNFKCTFMVIVPSHMVALNYMNTE